MIFNSSLLFRQTECYHPVDLCEYLFDRLVQGFPKAIMVVSVVQSYFRGVLVSVRWQTSFQRSNSHCADAEEVERLLDKQLFMVPFLFVNDHECSGSRGFC
jgi:hypothetical protein